MSPASQPRLHANDPVALAVESHARNMEADGYGEFSMGSDGEQIVVGLGAVKVCGETYDLALLRLAGALLDHAKFCAPFLARMRNPAQNPPAVHLRDNHLTARTTARRP